MMKRITSFILSFIMILSCVNINALANDEKVYFYDDFNSYPTNESNVREIIENTTALVKEYEKGDKALEVTPTISKSKVRWTWSGTDEELVVAFTVKETDGKSPVEFYLSNGNSDTMLLYISAEGGIHTHDGKKIGGISLGTARDIAVHVNTKYENYDIYIDGKCCLADWAVPKASLIPTGAMLLCQMGDTEGAKVYFDSIRAYEGDNVKKQFKKTPFNTQSVDILDIPEKVGNAVFSDNTFESDELITAAAGFLRNPKENLLRIDKEGENRYLYMGKNSDTDMHVDRTLVVDCNYLIFQMDMRFKKFGNLSYPFIIGDAVTNSSRADEYLGTINSIGELRIGRNGKAIKKINLNIWYNIAYGLDLNKRTFSVYLNGELISEGNPISNANLQTVTLVRTWLNGTDDIIFEMDNYKIYESKAPLTNLENDTMISVMPDGSRAQKVLEGRTAIDVNSGNVFSGEKKNNIETAVETDGEYYLSPETVKLLLDITPGSKDTVNGKTPIISFAKKSGFDVYNNGKGLLVFSKQPFKADDELLEEVAGYMFFQRPTAEQVKADFAAKNMAHPRVIVSKEDFDRVRSDIASDADAAAWHKKMIAKADTLLNSKVDVYELEAGIRLLAVSRSVKEKMEHWGYAYQITGDKKYVEAAWSVMESVCSFPNWHPNHYIDTAEMMFAVGIGYDWMYDAWTAEQKKIMEEAILELGIKCSYLAYYGKLIAPSSTGSGSGAAFVTEATNFNAVSNAGTLAASIAVADVYPDICFDTISKSIQSTEYMLPKFAPDGGWEEGMNYWNYTINYLAKFICSMETALGTDYGIMDYPGLSQTAYFAIHLDSYQGLNSFHDTWPGGHVNTAELGWFARVYDNNGIAANRYNSIKSFNLSPTIYDLIWYDKTAKDAGLTLEKDHRTRGIETVSIRENWDRSDGLFFSTHGGETHVYHGHRDGANYVFDLLGERWALEVVPEDYNTKMGTSQHQWYNVRAEGHNMIIINPDKEEDFWVDSCIYLTRYETKPKGGIVVFDTSEGYKRNASAAKRGFYVGDERRSLTVRDEVSLSKPNSTVYWFMHTKADIRVEGNKAILSLNGKELQVEFLSNANKMEILSMDASPLPGTWDMPTRTKNTGIRKLAVKLNASGNVYIEAKMSAVGEPASESGMINKPIDEWTLPDGELIERGDSFVSNISANGNTIPGFSPNTPTYTMGVLEGTELPHITAISENGYVEIKQAENINDITTITSYDKNRHYKTVYVINYKELKIPDDVMGMTRNVVENVTVSSTPEPENASVNMLDGNLSTRWSGNGVGEWAQLDLGSVKPIDAVALAYWKGGERIYKFEIQVSEDGDYYKSVYSGSTSGIGEDYELIDFDRVNARYVKLVGSGNTVNAWNNIIEFAPLTEKGGN